MIEGIIGFVLGAGLYHAYQWQVKREVMSVYMREKGNRGNAAREEKSSRMNEAILRAVTLQKEGMELKEMIPTLAKEFPDVALQLGAKIMSGKIKGLEGLI